MNNPITVVRITPFQGRSHVRALAEIEYAGVKMRGLKLEKRGGELVLGMPGRKIAHGWQVIYELTDPELYAVIRRTLIEHSEWTRVA